jgi:hypothetical protein
MSGVALALERQSEVLSLTRKMAEGCFAPVWCGPMGNRAALVRNPLACLLVAQWPAFFAPDGTESAKFPHIARFFPSNPSTDCKPEEIPQWQCLPLMS